jgi:WD40 repeat protein
MAYRAVFLLLFLACMTGIAAAQDAEIEIDSQTGTAYGLAWSPDGAVLAVTSGHELTLYSADLESILAETTEDESGAPFLNVAWNPDGTQLATVSGFRNPDILIWDWDADAGALELATTLEGDATSINSLQRVGHQYGVAWCEAGLISLAHDQTSLFQVWDMDDETVTGLYDAGYVVPLYTFTWVLDVPSMVGAGQEEDGERPVLFAMDATVGNSETLFPLPEGATTIGFTDDYTYVAAADAEGEVSVIDLATGFTIHRFSSLAQPVDIEWHEDQVAILSYEDGLQIWDLGNDLP